MGNLFIVSIRYLVYRPFIIKVFGGMPADDREPFLLCLVADMICKDITLVILTKI